VSRDETRNPEEGEAVRQAFVNGTVSGYEIVRPGQGVHARAWFNGDPGT